jgi:hypothetical protein
MFSLVKMIESSVTLSNNREVATLQNNMPRYMIYLVLFACQYIQDRAVEFQALKI